MQVIDLTHTINSTSPFWPGSEDTNPFSYEPIATHPSGAASLGAYSTVEHYGTHIDAPIHFKDNELTVDQIELTNLFAPLAVIDVREKCSKDPDYRLTVEDITDWESVNGPLPKGAVILMSTGWSEKWPDIEAYRNLDQNGKMHFPGFSVAVNEFLISDRDIKGIGIDNFSVDYGMSEGFEAHLITNGAGKYHLENVANVHLLPQKGSYIVVAPIKLENGSGGQTRIYALIP